MRIAGCSPESETFERKAEARDWALDRERKLRSGARPGVRTFGDLLERYGREVSPTKPSGPHEQKRIAFYLSDPIALVPLAEFNSVAAASFRDRRVRHVSGGTIIRDMKILSHACNIARKEWKWLDANPFSDLRRPADNPARDRLITDEEVGLLRYAAGTDYQYATARVIAALEFAIETAMRGGEICGLTANQIDRIQRVAHLTQSKNGDKRDVPLSQRALEILALMPDGDFGLSPAIKDALFRKIRRRAGLDDINFHDSRHTAITRLSRKLDVLALARMVGHRDIRQLQVYYNESAAELAKRL